MSKLDDKIRDLNRRMLRRLRIMTVFTALCAVFCLAAAVFFETAWFLLLTAAFVGLALYTGQPQ